VRIVDSQSSIGTLNHCLSMLRPGICLRRARKIAVFSQMSGVNPV
jgi:hypothetical protein